MGSDASLALCILLAAVVRAERRGPVATPKRDASRKRAQRQRRPRPTPR
jgi:hypothetical protein